MLEPNSVVFVVEVETVVRLLEGPEVPLDGTIGPTLEDEFVDGNGGVDVGDEKDEKLLEPELSPVVSRVVVENIVALEGPVVNEEELLEEVSRCVEVKPDAGTDVIVEFGTGNGANVLELSLVKLLGIPVLWRLDVVEVPTVVLPVGKEELIFVSVGMSVEFEETGPGLVGTRLPVDPAVVDFVLFDKGNGSELLLILVRLDVVVINVEEITVGLDVGIVELLKG